MLAGSPPSAIATGMVSPRCAISRQCAAPTLWRCQCIASSRRPITWTRYMPTLRTPVRGSRVITPASVMYGPPSSGQHTGTGNCDRSTSSARSTTSWQGGFPPIVLGGNLATSASCGSIASLPSRLSGTFRLRSVAMRSPMSSRQSTPSASAMRALEPNRFTATGWRAAAPDKSVGRVNSRAGPPPRDFMQRSAISVISLSTATGRSTRTSSPRASSAPRKSRRLSSAMMDGADPAAQELVAHAREAGALEPAREGDWIREIDHRLWQVRIGVPMFRHRAPDRRKHAPEVEQVEGAHRSKAGRGELEDHEAGAGPEHAVRFPEDGVQIRKVPHPEGHHGTVEPGVDEREGERVGADGSGAWRFVLPPRQHGEHEVRAEHGPAEPGRAGERRREIERAGAEIEIGAVGSQLPREPSHRGAAPGAVHIEAQEMVQQVVARRDRGEHADYVRPLRFATRVRGNLERRMRRRGGRHRRER